MPETASICRYLDTHFNEHSEIQLQPNNPEGKAYHDSLCAIISIDIDKALMRDYLLEFAFPKGEGGNIRFEEVKKSQPQVAKALNVISTQLEKHKALLAGEHFTIADALLAPMLAYLASLPAGYNLLSDYPNIGKYLSKLMVRPSCRKVLQTKSF